MCAFVPATLIPALAACARARRTRVKASAQARTCSSSYMLALVHARFVSACACIRPCLYPPALLPARPYLLKLVPMLVPAPARTPALGSRSSCNACAHTCSCSYLPALMPARARTPCSACPARPPTRARTCSRARTCLELIPPSRSLVPSWAPSYLPPSFVLARTCSCPARSALFCPFRPRFLLI